MPTLAAAIKQERRGAASGRKLGDRGHQEEHM